MGAERYRTGAQIIRRCAVLPNWFRSAPSLSTHRRAARSPLPESDNTGFMQTMVRTLAIELSLWVRRYHALTSATVSPHRKAVGRFLTVKITRLKDSFSQARFAGLVNVLNFWTPTRQEDATIKTLTSPYHLELFVCLPPHGIASCCSSTSDAW